MEAIVNVPVCGLYKEPTEKSTLEDEVLYGMVVEILDETVPGWFQIRTHYGYEGYVGMDALLIDEDTVSLWCAMPKKVVRYKNFADVLSVPKVQAYQEMLLPKGAVVRTLAEPENGWQEILLADGEIGFVPAAILDDYRKEPLTDNEEKLRKALVDAALSYSGTHYRWGGKSPMGIDCSGLCSMAYMLCGILIYRDAKLKEGFPIHVISLESIRPGDLLYFPGHIAMYIGDGKYCHATAKAGCNGFVINSLNPDDPDYREDLRNTITAVGSYFCRSGA